MSTRKALQEETWHCNMELPRLGLVIHTFGNASVFDPDLRLVGIKPSGVPYEDLRPDDIIVVDLDNTIVEGTRRPSSDTRTHMYLYRNFPGIRGVVHTHSTYAVAWAQAMRPVPILGTTHADHLATDIPCTPPMTEEMIAGDYEEETGKLIVRTFDRISPQAVPMVLVAGHGPFVWGETSGKAVYHASMIEELARMAYLTLMINPDTPRLDSMLINKHYQRKHGPASYYGQTNANQDSGEHQ